MEKINLSVIIPAYNEAESIESVVLNLRNELNNLSLKYSAQSGPLQDGEQTVLSWEIIIVNDASTDNTKNVLENIQNIGQVKIINHQNNKGYGASLKTGIKNAKYNWILIIDADGTYPIHSIPEFIKNTNKYDLITGRRDTLNSAIPFERKHAKRFLNKFASYLAGKEIPDLNCGLRIFKKDIILKYWELFPDKFSFTSTLTMVAMTHGYETKFIPIDYYKRQGKSTLKATDFFSFIKLVIKLSLFFKPIKVFIPISLFLLLIAIVLIVGYYLNLINVFLDITVIVLCATALQTFFFGLLAEIIIHNK